MPWRTPEQIAADDALNAAVEQAAIAYKTHTPGGLVTRFIVLGEAYVPGDDEANDAHETFTLMRNGSLSPVDIMGLIRCADADWSNYVADGGDTIKGDTDD